MNEHTAPKIPKWPFLIGDILLVAVAWFIAFKLSPPLGIVPAILLVGCVGGGAWICILPFLRDHQAEVKAKELDTFKSASSELENMRSVANQISFATAQWQVVHEQASKTISAATEISEKMMAESQAFSEFMLKANDAEKAHLRLEVEKMRRAEGDWLQTIVRTLDHVYALYLAGAKSGQTTLRDQLGHFQNACRDAARRIGVTPFEAKEDEAFDERKHQLPDPKAKVPSKAKIAETLATGFTYQGRIVRPAIVSLQAVDEEEEDQEDNQLLLEEQEQQNEELAAEPVAETTDES